MNSLISIVSSTVPQAAIYTLIGASFVMVYRATGVLSLAQGYFMVLGATLFYWTVVTLGLPAVVAAIVSLLVLAAVGIVVYAVVFRRLLGANPIVASMATIFLGTVLSAITVLVFGAETRRLPAVVDRSPRDLGIMRLSSASMVTIAVAIVTIAGVAWWSSRTSWGLRMRATADNPWLAPYAGVSVHSVSALGWALGAVFATLAGIAYTLTTVLDPGTLPSIGFSALPAILLGGMDSIRGVVAGAVILALSRAVLVTYVGGDYVDVVAYLLMLVVLLFRPSGLFGRPVQARI